MARNQSCRVKGVIARVPISVKCHDPLRLLVVSYRNPSDASHDKNRVV